MKSKWSYELHGVRTGLSRQEERGFNSLYHRTSSKWSARKKIHRVAHEKSIWECANVGGLGRSVKSLLRLSRFESYHSHI